MLKNQAVGDVPVVEARLNEQGDRETDAGDQQHFEPKRRVSNAPVRHCASVVGVEFRFNDAWRGYGQCRQSTAPSMDSLPDDHVGRAVCKLQHGGE